MAKTFSNPSNFGVVKDAHPEVAFNRRILNGNVLKGFKFKPMFIRNVLTNVDLSCTMSGVGGKSFIAHLKQTRMETKEKILFFEYSIGSMALVYELRKTGLTKDEILSKLRNLDTTEISALLGHFVEKNDFSKIKAFGLFYRLIDHMGLESEQASEIKSRFAFSTVNFHRNIERSLYEIYSQLQNTQTHLEFSHRTCRIRNQKRLIDLLTLNVDDADLTPLAQAEQVMQAWILRDESFADLMLHDWEFQRKRRDSTYLIYEVK